MNTPSLKQAAKWLASNDDTDWVNHEPDEALGMPSVTASLVADLFGVDEERVRREIKKYLKPANL